MVILNDLTTLYEKKHPCNCGNYWNDTSIAV